MYVLGVDCAWTEKEPSGVALVEYKPREGIRLINLGRSYTEFCSEKTEWDNRVYGSFPDCTSLLEYCARNGWDVGLVALDIPLSSELISERRSCDDEISRYYGPKWASVHSPSAERPGQIAVKIFRQLTEAGFVWNDRNAGKPFIEVYPHASIIEMFGLNKRLPYKVQKKSKYWPDCSTDERNKNIITNLNKLREGIEEHVDGVGEIFPVLDSTEKYQVQFLKGYEDALDALICAITGVYFHDDQVRCFGKGEEKIWVAEPTNYSKQLKGYIPSGAKKTTLPGNDIKNHDQLPTKAPLQKSKVMKTKTTDAGYMNRNNQVNKGKTNMRGTDHGQWFYQMECQRCGFEYLANGTDIWQRKCPKCQGGRP